MNQFLMNAAQTLRPFIGEPQLEAMFEACHGEERTFMIDKLSELESCVITMPKTYDQDGKGDEAVAQLHYFKGGMDWYITEKDIEGDQYQAFGLADLGTGYPEIGYINLVDLTKHGVELDLHWIPKTIGKIKELMRSAGKLALAATVAVSLSACASPVWQKPNTTQAEWEQTKAECMIEASHKVPPHDILVPVAGTSYVSHSCDNKGRNCTESSSFMPPTVQTVDTNAPMREQTIRACLTRKGWNEIKP